MLYHHSRTRPYTSGKCCNLWEGEAFCRTHNQDKSKLGKRNGHNKFGTQGSRCTSRLCVSTARRQREALALAQAFLVALRVLLRRKAKRSGFDASGGPKELDQSNRS